MPDHRLQFLAMNIVNQLFDLAEVPVGKRQAINDEADAFVYRLLVQHADPLCPRCFDTFGLAATHNYDCPALIDGSDVVTQDRWAAESEFLASEQSDGQAGGDR